MRSNLTLLFILFPLFCLADQQSPTAETNSLVLSHVTVIDTTGGPAKPDMTIVIIGDRIAEMGKDGEIQPPKNAKSIDGRGKFLIPGLWDMHVHWYDKDYLPLFIANGVTGIRQMYGVPAFQQWKKEIQTGKLLGPHLLIPSPIVDGPKPVWPGSMAVTNASEGRQAVAEIKRSGADFVKVYSLLPRDAYFAIADESKKEGIPFEGHVPDSVTLQEASDAGQLTVEHLTGVLAACSSHEAELLKSAQTTAAAINAGQLPSVRFWGPEFRTRQKLALETYSPQKAETVFGQLKKNHTWQCPTLTVLRSMAYSDDPSFTNDPRLKYLPRDIVSSWDPKADPFLKDKTAEDWAISKKVFTKDLELVGEMERAGVEILAGTDTLNPYCLPGFSLHDELGLLVQSGLTPLQALQAATLNPARFLGRENELGTVSQSKIADLVLLDANPLDDIANTRKISAVVLGGKFFSRSSLDGMLAKIEALASRKPVGDILLKTIQEQNVEAAIKQYYDLKRTQPGAYDFGEGAVGDLGDRLVEMKRFNDALRIYQLNVEANPSSYTYDSLGEACLSASNKECATKSFRKALELSPNDINASESLKKLNAPSK
ncbi:MAG: amidohydrolase family protein [Acidobacteriaceae bacterium]|nr:amidohydrolase family protein [Acidobacteriaceae bacterium]